MSSHQVVDLKGNKLGEVGLEEKVFGIKPNEGVLHSALIRQLANARAGTAKAKTRAEVSGGGKKPWRQKGTGRARAGSIRSPLWEGGGVIFGPKPRDFSIGMPKKVRLLALKSALAARRGELVVVKNFAEIKNGKTKEVATALSDLKLTGKKVLLVLEFAHAEDTKVQLAARNIEGLKIIHVNNLNVKDILESEALLMNESTIESINKRFKSSHKERTGKTAVKDKAHKSEAHKTEAKSQTKAEAPKKTEKTQQAKTEKFPKTEDPKAKTKSSEQKKPKK